MKKLESKDLITIGIFTALYFFLETIGGTIAYLTPVTAFLGPIFVAILTGPVYMLLLAKVPKTGSVMLLGIIIAIIVYFGGVFWLWPVASVVLAVIAAFIAKAGDFKSHRLNTMSFMVYALNPIGSMIMFWVNQDYVKAYLMDQGMDGAYLDSLIQVTDTWLLLVMLIGTLLAALISANLGKRLMKKQFEKAGIV